MTFYERLHDTPKHAFRAALANCIREQGRICEAYGGVDCKNCEVREEGIKRRAKRTKEEKKETIAHHGLINGPYIRIRKRCGEEYWHLEIGRWVGKPQLFQVEKSLLVQKELIPLIAPLYEVALKDVEQHEIKRV